MLGYRVRRFDGVVSGTKAVPSKYIFMLLFDSTCRAILSTVYLRVRLSVGARAAISVFGSPRSLFVFSPTLWPLRLVNSSVFEVTMCVAQGARSTETVLCTPYLSLTRECELTAIMQNGPRLRDINLLYIAIEILWATLDFVPDKRDLSIKTSSHGQVVDVSRTRRT